MKRIDHTQEAERLMEKAPVVKKVSTYQGDHSPLHLKM